MSLRLYQFHISPYCGKIRAILQYKGLDYRVEPVHPIKRWKLLWVTGQKRVPVLVHDTRVIIDSTRIARYVDEHFPENPIYPRGRRDQAQALLWEDWADESLQRTVGPLKFIDRENARRMASLENQHHPADVERTYQRLQPIIARQMATFGGTGSLTVLKARLNELTQILSDRLEGLYLVGKQPSIADFSVYAVLEPFEHCNGWYLIEEHANLMRWFQRMKELTTGQRRAEGRSQV